MTGVSGDGQRPDLWHALEVLKSRRAFPRGARLFEPGQRADGIYVVEKGEVRLLVAGRGRSERVLNVAGSGAVLGLSESLTDEPYKLAAEADDSVEVAFVARDALLEFLRNHQEFCMEVVRALSEDLHGLYQRFRLLSDSSKGRRPA